ncbi:hypothetical protein [Rhodococcus marinonascens]|uniref:hypothetical protein n=1 Tax=Rhodococcus marinonascens TaxID=38311 RepID=UPI0009322A6A|nr:hypothetical protein [Rhodococcus marinonascens]
MTFHESRSTYNTRSCTCGKDHDRLEHITAAVLFCAGQDFVEKGIYYQPIELGDAVAEAATRVGWRYSPARITSDLNEKYRDCPRGLVHSTLQSIVSAALSAAFEEARDDGEVTNDVVALMVAKAAAESGWFKTGSPNSN